MVPQNPVSGGGNLKTQVTLEWDNDSRCGEGKTVLFRAVPR